MVRILVLVIVLILAFLLLYWGIRWLWRTATGQPEEVDGEKVAESGWKSRLPAIVLGLFVLLGILLIADRVFNSEEQGVRYYTPATLDKQGHIESGRRY